MFAVSRRCAGHTRPRCIEFPAYKERNSSRSSLIRYPAIRDALCVYLDGVSMLRTELAGGQHNESASLCYWQTICNRIQRLSSFES